MDSLYMAATCMLASELTSVKFIRQPQKRQALQARQPNYTCPKAGFQAAHISRSRQPTPHTQHHTQPTRHPEQMHWGDADKKMEDWPMQRAAHAPCMQEWA